MTRRFTFIVLVSLLILAAPGLAHADGQTGLIVRGPTSIKAGSSATYSALIYSDGSYNTVAAKWSVTPATYASISSTGVLQAVASGANQTVTVDAAYSSGEGTLTASLEVTITGSTTSATLTGLSISGPATAAGGSTASYTATASYSNGTSARVTPAWSVTPTTYASISSTGVLTTKQVTSNQGVTIDASYTQSGVTKTASLAVTITGGTTSVTLTGLSISGPATAAGGSTASYTATASYSNGTSARVTPAWSVTPTTYASISSTGVLTTKQVTSNQGVTIDASYTQSGVTKTASLSVTITNGTAPTPPIGSVNNSGVIVLASTDLGMHCVCPTYSSFMLLPPYNTIRAQVIRKGGDDPQVLGASSGIKVAYSIMENTNASLSADPYYQNWMQNAPKLGFKNYPVLDANGNIQSPITGAKISGYMTAQSPDWWEVVGVPAFPDVSNLSTSKPLVDPLGGPNRNPYLTGIVKVYDSSNNLLAQTALTIPTAFGGCCNCHLKVAAQLNYPATEQGSLEAMGFLHSQNSSGIDISQIDPDGDGVPGPIRCSQCHLDPAMGDKAPPGGNTLNGKTLPVSKYTLSDVIHRFHAQNGTVLGEYDPNIAMDCYKCHPGNGINCYRGVHTTEPSGTGSNLWCTNCHGDLNQRIAQNQMANPWSVATLPKCATCHTSTTIGENPTLGIFGGAFLNSMTHGGPLLCSTCHGEPHGLNPSTLAHDNMQNAALQAGNSGPIGTCSLCHTDRSGYVMPPHSTDN